MINRKKIIDKLNKNIINEEIGYRSFVYRFKLYSCGIQEMNLDSFDIWIYENKTKCIYYIYNNIINNNNNNGIIEFIDYIYDKLNYSYYSSGNRKPISLEQIIDLVYFLERMENLEIFS